MPRMARIVIPNIPHHIVQRGNRKQRVFFNNKDKRCYLDYLDIQARKTGIKLWAYCLMDNHVHLIAVPETEASLAEGIGEAHRKYTLMVNSRQGWKGYLWQGRFLSFPLDKQHLYSAVRYIERNPIRAGLVKKPENYLWSSAKARVLRKKDPLLEDNFLSKEIADWSLYLAEENNQTQNDLFRKHARTGRPLGSKEFIEKISNIAGRDLRKGKPGPKINN